jgi:serpin B
MKFLAILCLLGAAPTSAASIAAQQRAPQSPEAAALSVAQGNAAFGVELYKKLGEEAKGNLFISPISVAGAFGPVAAGAEGETRAAIDKAMRFPAGPALHPALGRMLKDLERKRGGVTLSIANALWVKKEFALKPAFQRIARESYDARVEAVDFERAPKAAERRINEWVAKETRGRIPGIVSADDFDRYTRLVITNAVYFLGDWATPFPLSQTKEQPFYGPGGATRQIPLMHQRADVRYVETDSFQAIDLPYRDPTLSMSLFLPKSRDGLANFEAQLSEEALRLWLGKLDQAGRSPVLIHLPKLKIEGTYDLLPPLGEMGMGVAFTDRANLRGIADEPLMVDRVVQKTFLRMDEKGTEAVAVTAIGVVATGMRISKPPVFRADHPFFLVIREKGSGAVLFLGRIVAPEPA